MRPEDLVVGRMYLIKPTCNNPESCIVCRGVFNKPVKLLGITNDGVAGVVLRQDGERETWNLSSFIKEVHTYNWKKL